MGVGRTTRGKGGGRKRKATKESLIDFCDHWQRSHQNVALCSPPLPVLHALFCIFALLIWQRAFFCNHQHDCLRFKNQSLLLQKFWSQIPTLFYSILNLTVFIFYFFWSYSTDSSRPNPRQLFFFEISLNSVSLCQQHLLSCLNRKITM